LDGLALSFGASNQVSLLMYPAVDAGGHTNLTYPLGSVRFLYRAPWSSRQPGAGAGYGWGRGPGAWARLFTLFERTGAQVSPLVALD
jgi:hypothetical protein